MLQPGRHPGHSGIKRHFESRQGAAARGRFCCVAGRHHLHVAVVCRVHSRSAQDDEQSRPTPPAENALINELIREYTTFPPKFTCIIACNAVISHHGLMYLEYNGLFHSLDVLCCEAGMPRQALDRAFVQSQLRCTAFVGVSFLFFPFVFFLSIKNRNDLIPQHQSWRSRNEDAPPVRLHPNAQRLVSLPQVFHAQFLSAGTRWFSQHPRHYLHLFPVRFRTQQPTGRPAAATRSRFPSRSKALLVCLFDPPLLRFYWRRLRFQRWTCKWCRRIGLWLHCWTTRLQR